MRCDSYTRKWGRVSLGSVCQITSSKRIFAKDYKSSGIPFYRGKEIIEKHKGNAISTELFISAEKYDEIKRKYDVPQIGDILLTSVGTLGVPWLVNETDFYFKDGNLTWLRSSKELLNQYLYLWLNSPDAKHQIDAKCIGSTQKALTIESLNKFSIPLPSLCEQERICAMIYPILDKIKLNQRINENLERQAEAVFKSWFVDFEPFGGKTPTDWKYIDFSKFLTVSTEKSSDSSLPMFSVTDKGIFPRDELFKKNLSTTNSKSKVIRQTDLVFGMSREILNWGIMRHPIGGVSSAYNVYHVSNSINTFYLESYMKANYQYFKDLIRPASREGQGIDKKALMKKVILVPPQEILEKYYHIEQKLIELARHAPEENQQLAELRDALLPKLMSGEIDAHNVKK